MSYISDKQYHEMSQMSYYGPKAGERLNDPNWKVVEPEGAKLHGKISGFDAAVFYNEKTNQVVIGYRGTEAEFGDQDQTMNRIMDFETDAADVVFGKYRQIEERLESPVKTAILNSPLVLLNDYIEYENNQFHQAEELYEAVKKQYPNAEITATGHSLGGALTQFVAVRNGISGVTFSAPSVTNLLSDELLEQVNNGDFDQQIVNYVHPSDSVGAGPFSEYKRHIGSTYYIGNDFDSANQKYDDLDIPVYMKFSPPVKIGNFPGEWGPGQIQRALDSFSGKDGQLSYHALENYTFDQNGNISNSLVDRNTGQPFEGSPRWNNYVEAIAAWETLMNRGSDLIHSWAEKFLPVMALIGGSTIQLQPEELKDSSQRIKQHVQEFQQELPATMRSIQRLMDTSQSRSLQPIVQRTIDELNQFIRWYASITNDVAYFINKKADDFIRADQGVNP